jgi:hypothetical protein
MHGGGLTLKGRPNAEEFAQNLKQNPQTNILKVRTSIRQGGNKLNETEATKSWFSRRVEKEVENLDVILFRDRVIGIFVVVVFSLIVLYFVAHQMWSTGFFTTTFGTLEMFLFYGSWIEWIAVAALEGLGRKNLSRDIDAFGGLIFVTVGTTWLFLVFPFEFAYFGDVLPDFLRFLVQWISNDVARVLMALGIIVNLVAAVYYGILRVFVRKARARKTF